MHQCFRFLPGDVFIKHEKRPNDVYSRYEIVMWASVSDWIRFNIDSSAEYLRLQNRVMGFRGPVINGARLLVLSSFKEVVTRNDAYGNGAAENGDSVFVMTGMLTSGDETSFSTIIIPEKWLDLGRFKLIECGRGN